METTAPRMFGWSSYVLLAAVVACYGLIIVQLAGQWSRNPDYSHGFIVPLVSAYFLWSRRRLRSGKASPSYGMAALMFAIAAAMRGAGVAMQYTLMEPASLLPCLAGAAFLIGGWTYFRWTWPSILFLGFAIPLPGLIAGRMAGPLQQIATHGSTYVLQTLGIPAAAVGNVILLSNGEVGVAEACNGLRMLVAFLAIAFAITVTLKVPVWERLFVLLSGVAVALLCNIVRIAATGVVYDRVSPELAERIFHDFAGWLMMPLATGILALEIWLLGSIFPATESDSGPLILQRSRGEPSPSTK